MQSARQGNTFSTLGIFPGNNFSAVVLQSMLISPEHYFKTAGQLEVF